MQRRHSAVAAVAVPPPLLAPPKRRCAVAVIFLACPAPLRRCPGRRNHDYTRNFFAFRRKVKKCRAVLPHHLPNFSRPPRRRHAPPSATRRRAAQRTVPPPTLSKTFGPKRRARAAGAPQSELPTQTRRLDNLFLAVPEQVQNAVPSPTCR